MVNITNLVEEISFKYGGIEEIESLLTYKEDVVLRSIAIEGMTVEQVADKTRTPTNDVVDILEDIFDKLENNFDIK